MKLKIVGICINSTNQARNQIQKNEAQTHTNYVKDTPTN